MSYPMMMTMIIIVVVVDVGGRLVAHVATGDRGSGSCGCGNDYHNTSINCSPLVTIRDGLKRFQRRL